MPRDEVSRLVAKYQFVTGFARFNLASWQFEFSQVTVSSPVLYSYSQRMIDHLSTQEFNATEWVWFQIPSHPSPPEYSGIEKNIYSQRKIGYFILYKWGSLRVYIKVSLILFWKLNKVSKLISSLFVSGTRLTSSKMTL